MFRLRLPSRAWAVVMATDVPLGAEAVHEGTRTVEEVVSKPLLPTPALMTWMASHQADDTPADRV